MKKTVLLAVPFGALVLASCSGGDIKAKCEKYKAEMTAHSQSNPALTGNFDIDAASSWNQKNKELAKEFIQATGLEYRDGDSLDDLQANMSAIMEASVKCKEAGVDIMKN
jgi:hypothetical protein